MNPKEQRPDLDLRMPVCNGVDIEKLSIEELQRCLKDGKFSARELSECFLERVNRINGLLK
jgi:amidase